MLVEIVVANTAQLTRGVVCLRSRADSTKSVSVIVAIYPRQRHHRLRSVSGEDSHPDQVEQAREHRYEDGDSPIQRGFQRSMANRLDMSLHIHSSNARPRKLCDTSYRHRQIVILVIDAAIAEVVALRPFGVRECEYRIVHA